MTGGDVRRLAARVSSIQDVLGEHHDAVVAVAWLRDAVVTGDADPELAFTAGALASRFAARRRPAAAAVAAAVAAGAPAARHRVF